MDTVNKLATAAIGILCFAEGLVVSGIWYITIAFH